MSDFRIKTEDRIPLTPPYSDDEDRIKLEPKRVIKPETSSSDDGVEESAPAKSESEKPPRKRGRPKSSETKNTKKPAKKSKVTPKTEKLDGESEQKPRKPRGRAAATGENFTPEQDAYIRELFTSEHKHTVKEIHKKFEERYNTGKSSNVVRFRWYNMKNHDITLSPSEEVILKKALETVENNKAMAVMNEYHNSGGDAVTKLTKGFIQKKMKEWSTEGRSNMISKSEAKEDHPNIKADDQGKYDAYEDSD